MTIQVLFSITHKLGAYNNMGKACWIFTLFLLFRTIVFSQERETCIPEPYHYEMDTAQMRKDLKNNVLIRQLREQLKFKFVLDFLIEYVYTKDSTGSRYNPALLKDQRHVGIMNIFARRAIEEFQLGDVFCVYRVNDLAGKHKYFLVVDLAPTPYKLYLLDNNTRRWKLLDSFEFGGNEADYEIENMGGYNIIKVQRRNFGSGRYTEDQALLGIVDGKFKTLFGNRNIELITPENGDAFRTLKKITMVDLNGDGYLDIVEETIEEVISKDVLKNPNNDEISQLKGKKLISRKKSKYYWNKMSYFFEKGL